MEREERKNIVSWCWEETMPVLIAFELKTREFSQDSRNEKSKWVDANNERRELPLRKKYENAKINKESAWVST